MSLFICKRADALTERSGRAVVNALSSDTEGSGLDSVVLPCEGTLLIRETMCTSRDTDSEIFNLETWRIRTQKLYNK